MLARRYQAIDLVQGRRLDLPAQTSQIILELRDRARSDDGRAHDGIGQHPGQGELGQGAAVRPGQRLQLLGHGKALRPHFRLQDAPVLPAGARFSRQVPVLAVLAAQHAAGQRAVHHDAQVVVAAAGKELYLGVPVDQVVEGLHAGEGGEIASLAGPQARGDLPGVEVGAAQVPDLALLHQGVERGQGLLYGREGIGPVEQVEVEVVGAEPPQAVLHLAEDVVAAAAPLVGPLSHGPPHLGGQHHLVAPVLEGLAHDALGFAAVVHIGGVDEIDAAIQGLVNDADGFFLVGGATEHHGAQAQARNLDAGSWQDGIVHCCSPQ